MPTEFEDGMGATDISGAPQPSHVRSPSDIRNDASGRVRGMQRGPQPGRSGPQEPQEGAASQSGPEQPGQPGERTPPPAQSPSVTDVLAQINPVDWSAMVANHPDIAQGLARQAHQALTGWINPGAIGTSIQHVFDGNSALAHAASVGLGGARTAVGLPGQAQNFYAGQVQRLYSSDDPISQMIVYSMHNALMTNPFIQPYEEFTQAKTGLEAATGRITPEEAVKEQRQADEQIVEQAPSQLLQTATIEVGGGVGAARQGLGMAAGLAPILPQLLSTNPDDRNQGLLWTAAMGSLFGVSHISPGARAALVKAFGDGWPKIEKQLQNALNLQKDANRDTNDPQKAAQRLKDFVQEQLSKDQLEAAFGRVKAKGQDPRKPRDVMAEVTPTGDVRLKTAEERAVIKKLLNRAGVDDVDELIHKAMTEGIGDKGLVDDITKNWKKLGFAYNLRFWHPDELPPQDPRRHLDTATDPKTKRAMKDHIVALNTLGDQIRVGMFANHSDAFTSIVRAMAGGSRGTRWAMQAWMHSTVRLMDKVGMLNEAGQEKVMRAAEGDLDAYNALPPEAQIVVDGWGLLRAATREADPERGVVANYVPRTDKLPEDMQRGRGRPSTSSVVAKESGRHREVALQGLPGGEQLILGQKFQYVQDANKALTAQRAQIEAELLLSNKPLSKTLQNNSKAVSIRNSRGLDPEKARADAKTLSMSMYPDKETNFLKNVNRIFGNQIQAMQTKAALAEFLQMTAKDGRAAARTFKSNRQRQGFLNEGYQYIEDPRFNAYVFHPDVASNLNRYVNHMASARHEDSKFWQTALKIEGIIVAGIMYSPVIHGMNIAGRMGMAGLMHPLEMGNYLLTGKRMPEELREEHAMAMRMEAYNGGVMPHFANARWVDQVVSKMQDEYGDMEDILPEKQLGDTVKNRMESMLDKAARPHNAVNNYFWGKVNDFGVMMFHLEKAAAKKGVPLLGIPPMDDAAATEYAGRRANSWMGMVMPEDKNPMYHNLARLAFFAPNWWRTWGELLVPMYKRAGFMEDPAAMRFLAYQGAKTTMAALAFQKATGEVLNLALSGHLQQQNQPGNQDRLEISNGSPLGGAVLDVLRNTPILPQQAVDPATGKPNTQYVDPTGTNPYTGGRYTIENPLARQTLDVETALGLASGHNDWQPQDMWDGMAKEVAARISPFVDALAAGLNMDLYHTATDRSLRAVDPSRPAFSMELSNAMYLAMAMSPAWLTFEQEVQNQAQQGNTQAVSSLYGTQVPQGIGQHIGDVGNVAERTLFSGLTGINPAYVSAQRTRGLKPTDQAYREAAQYQEAYLTQMHNMDMMTLHGQMSPSQWRTMYHDLSQRHSAQMNALYNGSPQYVNGSEGMLADWEDLYTQATNPSTGQVDYDKLSQLQNGFKLKHTPDQLQQMNALLDRNDSRFRMLKLYHSVQQGYDKFQTDWAAENGMDLNTLRKQISEYGALFGDARGERQYLSAHPELAAYERSKHRNWALSPQGVIWNLFYGNSTATSRYLREQGGITASQLVAQAAQQVA